MMQKISWSNNAEVFHFRAWTIMPFLASKVSLRLICCSSDYSIVSFMFTFQMDSPARQSVLGTYDFVAVGIYYVLVLTVSVYVSLHFI
jgi:hypothetical protein